MDSELKLPQNFKGTTALLIFRTLIVFSKTCIALVQKPYETYRQLSKGEMWYQVIPLFVLVSGYFGISLLLRKGITSNPFVLTFSFVSLNVAFYASFITIVTALFFLGKMVGGKGTFKNIFLPWSYSLIPTLLWFCIVSLLWIILPPPRTTSLSGQLFSILFIAFSVGLLLWKLELYYLTLRFGMKLNLQKIAVVSVFFIPFVILLSLLLYFRGIFRIPFF